MTCKLTSYRLDALAGRAGGRGRGERGRDAGGSLLPNWERASGAPCAGH